MDQLLPSLPQSGTNEAISNSYEALKNLVELNVPYKYIAQSYVSKIMNCAVDPGNTGLIDRFAYSLVIQTFYAMNIHFPISLDDLCNSVKPKEHNWIIHNINYSKDAVEDKIRRKLPQIHAAIGTALSCYLDCPPGSRECIDVYSRFVAIWIDVVHSFVDNPKVAPGLIEPIGTISYGIYNGLEYILKKHETKFEYLISLLWELQVSAYLPMCCFYNQEGVIDQLIGSIPKHPRIFLTPNTNNLTNIIRNFFETQPENIMLSMFYIDMSHLLEALRLHYANSPGDTNYGTELARRLFHTDILPIYERTFDTLTDVKTFKLFIGFLITTIQQLGENVLVPCSLIKKVMCAFYKRDLGTLVAWMFRLHTIMVAQWKNVDSVRESPHESVEALFRYRACKLSLNEVCEAQVKIRLAQHNSPPDFSDYLNEIKHNPHIPMRVNFCDMLPTILSTLTKNLANSENARNQVKFLMQELPNLFYSVGDVDAGLRESILNLLSAFDYDEYRKHIGGLEQMAVPVEDLLLDVFKNVGKEDKNLVLLTIAMKRIVKATKNYAPAELIVKAVIKRYFTAKRKYMMTTPENNTIAASSRRSAIGDALHQLTIIIGLGRGSSQEKRIMDALYEPTFYDRITNDYSLSLCETAYVYAFCSLNVEQPGPLNQIFISFIESICNGHFHNENFDDCVTGCKFLMICSKIVDLIMRNYAVFEQRIPDLNISDLYHKMIMWYIESLDRMPAVCQPYASKSLCISYYHYCLEILCGINRDIYGFDESGQDTKESLHRNINMEMFNYIKTQ